MSLPTDYKARKELPIGTGVLDYFPRALAAVAEASLAGNRQHMPGQPLHWDRSKSSDEADALIRHFIDRGTVDTDGVRHSAKMAWRALALLEKEIEAADRTQSENNRSHNENIALLSALPPPSPFIADVSPQESRIPPVAELDE